MAETPENGSVIETTTRKRVIPVSKVGPPPNVWDYLAALSPAEWSNHIIYVYRDDPPPSMQVAKCSTPVLEGTNAPWSDQEEMEAAFAQRFGGGQYRLMVKRGSERVCYAKIVIPGAYKNLMPRAPEPNQYMPGPQVQPMNGYGYGDTARVAEAAINTMANQDKEAINLAISAVGQAATIVKNFSTQPPPAPSATDDVMKQMMVAMMQRALAPPPDPMEQMTRMMAFFREMNAGNSNGVGGSVIDKVIASVVERGLNPPPPVSTGHSPSLGAELIRVLPNIAGYVTQGMSDYARIMEAQRDAIAMQRGVVTGQVVPPQRPPNQVTQPQAPPLPAATPPPANGAPPMADMMSFIESKLMEIYNEGQSPEWTAEEAINFLDRMDPNIVKQLTLQGEQGLMALYNTRDLLKPALSNPARLTAFVRAFLQLARENGTEAEVPKPN